MTASLNGVPPNKWLPVAKVVAATLAVAVAEVITLILAAGDIIISPVGRLVLNLALVFIAGYVAPRAKPLPEQLPPTTTTDTTTMYPNT